MASSLAAAIQQDLPEVEVEIRPGRKGDFMIKADGKMLWDKLGRDGDFPEHPRIINLLRG